MPPTLAQLSTAGRQAAERKDWASLSACAGEILRQDARHPEGHFLRGLAEKAARRTLPAARAFEQALALDSARYDAAIELAVQYCLLQRHAQAKTLLESYEARLGNSPVYLNLAGTAYSMMSLHECAWPLHRRACELQPGVDLFQANLAACSVYMGEIAEARAIYQALLERFPTHQRNHYQLARLERAKDARHVDQMKEVLRTTNLPPEKNIFLYYALGKELEDLERWDEAFEYYKLAGDTITRMTNYDVGRDVRVIEKVIEVCTPAWLARDPGGAASGKVPIFIVGLPRTGTTLTERILSSHSAVATLDETLFLPAVLHREAGHPEAHDMTPASVEAAARADIRRIAQGYLDAVRYRLPDAPMFIDKLPENVLYAGFIAKAWADARIVHLRRHPMDACFAMYKQSFFKFAYSLDNIARYYVAYARLVGHWRAVLGERWVEVEYEALVADQERQTRTLLERLGLAFEPACLAFHENRAPSATASSVQVRERMHARSVGRWRHFARQLEPLRRSLVDAGVAVD